MPDPAILSETSSLEGWVQKLTEEEMPIFAQTVGEINRIMAAEEFSSLGLSRVILQDPSMTAKVLKLSNSVHYNPGGTPISTVSRSVVVLGFNAVQAICISIAVIESLVKGRAKERVMRELARSIHAATQAKAMAVSQRENNPEEVFVAGLLASLGQMAFWCFAGEEGKRLDLAMAAEPAKDPAELERRVLGFPLRELTQQLAETWNLSPLVRDFSKGKAATDPRGKYIDLGQKVAREVENGWNSRELRELAAEVGKLVGKSPGEVGQMLQNSAEEAVSQAKAMGAGAAARLIPLVNRKTEDDESTWAVQEAPEWCEPDPLLQLRILREITMTLGTKPDLSVLLEMVLEGIHRGIGMDRTVLALVAPRRNLVRAKHVLGVGRTKFLDRFEIEIGARTPNLFQRLLDTREPAWVDDYENPLFNGLLFGPIFDLIDRSPFLVQPVCFNGATIGLFYADRHPSGRTIDAETFESFKLFVHQANLGLEHIGRQRLAQT